MLNGNSLRENEIVRDYMKGSSHTFEMAGIFTTLAIYYLYIEV